MTPRPDPVLPLHEPDAAQLAHEHRVLVRHLAEAQTRCTALLRTQADAIDSLQAQTLRLRAAVIVRDSALCWEREDRAVLEAAIPGLPRRLTLARRVEDLLARIQDLMREQPQGRPSEPAGASAHGGSRDTANDLTGLEASLVAADLVICQTGCLSHGAYWRVQDHCARTGKACVLVDQPDALRIVRLRNTADTADAVRLAAIAEDVTAP